MKKKYAKMIATIIAVVAVFTSGCSDGNAKNSSVDEVQSSASTTPTATTSVTPETTPAVTTTAKPVEQTTVTTTTTKKQETNKPVVTTATTTTTTTTKPAPEWTEEKVSATKYVNTDCYSRKKAVLGAETVKIYNVNDKVKVVAKTDTGYFKLDTGAFVHGDYLSDSKVVVQTTTTTAKKSSENKPVANNEHIEIYALDASGHNDAWTYSDMDCTDAVSGYLTGTKIIAVKTYKDKGLYLIEDGLYARMSDFTTTPFVIEKWFNTATFDKKKVRQFIIDIAVKDFGLVLNEEMTTDNSSWFAPSCFPLSDDDGQVVKVMCMKEPESNYKLGYMQKGDSFNVVIKDGDAEEMNTLGGVGEGYAIFFLR